MAFNINTIRGAMNRANLRAMQQSTVTDLAITYSSNDPGITPDAALTISDGSAPSDAELIEYLEELKANQSAIILALENAGILI